MLDRTRPFGQVFRNGFPSGFVQDGREFDMEGRPVADVPPVEPQKRRGRPPRNPPSETE